MDHQTMSAQPNELILAALRRIDTLKAEIAEVTKALDECDLRPHGSLADRVRALSHHHREWKSMFATLSNKEAERNEMTPAELAKRIKAGEKWTLGQLNNKSLGIVPHIDHPPRHYDRTCPGCVADERDEAIALLDKWMLEVNKHRDHAKKQDMAFRNIVGTALIALDGHPSATVGYKLQAIVSLAEDALLPLEIGEAR